MRALLDTHAFLWWITDDSRLSLRARETLADGRNDLFFSAASGWEIAIKANLGKVEVPDDLERFLAEQLSRNAIQVLPIYLNHTRDVFNLVSPFVFLGGLALALAPNAYAVLRLSLGREDGTIVSTVRLRIKFLNIAVAATSSLLLVLRWWDTLF